MSDPSLTSAVTSVETGAPTAPRFGQFVSGVALTFGTRVLMLAGLLGSSILVAHWLGPKGYGTLAVLNATVALTLQIASAGLPSANTYFIARDRRNLGPVWANAVMFALVVGSLAALVIFALGKLKPSLLGGAPTTLLGIAALSLSMLIGMQLAFVGHDAFSRVRSAYQILEDAQRANDGKLDPAFPVYQVRSYDQTLPFYLGRPTPLVDYRDEMGPGLDAEPGKGFNEAAWIDAWNAAPQAYALMPAAVASELAAKQVPMRELARDPRRVFVARR